MKKALLFALLATGCGNSVQPFRITRMFPLSSDPVACSKGEDDTVIAGSAMVDVAAGSPQVTLGVEVTGLGYSTPGLKLRTGETLENPNSTQPILTNMKVTYRLSRRLGATPKVFNLPLSIPFADASGQLYAYAPVPLLSPEIGELLVNGLTGSDTLDDFVDIEADVEFEGENSASRAKFSTGIVTFPIRAVKSNPMPCPTTGTVFKRYPFVDAAGGIDVCRYVGQTFWKFGTAAPPDPADCCTPGSPGC